MLGNKSVSFFEIKKKKPVGFFEHDPDAEEVAVYLAKKGHELSFFQNLEAFEKSPDCQVIKISTSSPEMYQHLVTTGHKAFYIEQECCMKRTAALISEECLNSTSKATRFYLNL